MHHRVHRLPRGHLHQPAQRAVRPVQGNQDRRCWGQQAVGLHHHTGVGRHRGHRHHRRHHFHRMPQDEQQEEKGEGKNKFGRIVVVLTNHVI